MEHNAIIGRDREIEIVRDHVRQGESLHVYGPEGVGKTALIDYLCRTWGEIGTSRAPIYCEQSGTLEQILDTIAKTLLSEGKKLVDIDYERRTERLILKPEDLQTVQRRNLRNMVFPHIKRGNFYVILDHLENVTPRTSSFIKALYGCTPVITVSRLNWDEAIMAIAGASEPVHVSKLALGNLDKESAFNLMESLLSKHDLLKAKVPDSRRLFEDAYAVTQGNLKKIKNMFAKAMDPKCLHDSARK